MPRRALTAALLVVLVGLVPLAHASPPDPTWIAGLYDDDDYDDVVLAVTSGVGLTEHRLPTIARPVLGWSWSVHPRVAGTPCGVPATAFIARAPPTA